MLLRALHQRLTTSGPRSVSDHLLFALLGAAAWLFRLAVSVRFAAYRSKFLKSYRSPLPVVSVGNLTLGGTGKTPFVDLLLKWAVKFDVKVAVVSRGYGSSCKTGALMVADGSRLIVSDPAVCGDEPVLLARRNPAAMVIIAPKRKDGIRLAHRCGAQMIILDDGFQHLAVARDLDILLLDSKHPFGNGRLFPAGVLREPPAQLNRADVVILTRNDRGEALLPDVSAPLLRARHVPSSQAISLNGDTLALEELAARPCVVFAGIADPTDFFRSLRKYGITPRRELALLDHQVYAPDTYAQLSAAAHDAEFFLTTEKDAVKLQSSKLPLPCYSVGVDMVIDSPGPLEVSLQRLLSRSSPS